MKNKVQSDLYQPHIIDFWKGRHDEGIGSARFHELVIFHDLNEAFPQAHHEKTWGFIGFACHEGVRRNQGRLGANNGPDAIRKALSSFPVSMQEPAIFYDFGNIVCKDQGLEEAQDILGEVVADMLNNHIRPIVLGGGHETAWGNYLGIRAAYPNKDLGIVNFDSHFDLRPLSKEGLGNSGTSFLQMYEDRKSTNQNFNYYCLGVQSTANTESLFEKSNELNVSMLLADEFHEAGTEASVELCDEIISSKDYIYLSICLDVFAAPFAPGVSAIQPLGLLPWHVIPAIRRLAASQKVVSLDICELCPPFDKDEMTAKLAASLISIFIHSST